VIFTFFSRFFYIIFIPFPILLDHTFGFFVQICAFIYQICQGCGPILPNVFFKRGNYKMETDLRQSIKKVFGLQLVPAEQWETVTYVKGKEAQTLLPYPTNLKEVI
jgi:hypothetical protein